MGSKWRKVKLALGLNMCLYVPKTHEGSSPPSSSSGIASEAAASLSTASSGRPTPPTTPTPSSSGLRLSRSSSKSFSKKTCAICLTAMKPGQGHAIFTAECSHSFHFHCITSNVKHGNRICPVCRSKWKEIPFHPNSVSRINPIGGSRDDSWLTMRQQVRLSQPDTTRQVSSLFQNPEPVLFNDDEDLEHQDDFTERSSDSDKGNVTGTVEVKTYPEVSEVSVSVSHNDFATLIHLKAPVAKSKSSPETSLGSSRAAVDLVTVLDVSGSMAGTKLALLKRAMGFVIQNLGPFDRLSVIAFSSTARRIFPLRRMTEAGKHEALQAVNSLLSNGGTNIAEGLRKGAKVIVDRRWKNPVSSIILLSDGQDTYTVANPSGACSRPTDYKSLLPVSIQENSGTGSRIPVHAFGFGMDHDAASMHSISEISGGTFSFIEAEAVIQDAFAQCIGGLLSVVVQELCVEVECVHPGLRISSVKAGSYHTDTSDDTRTGCINVGDLYAEEERNFLVNIDVPVGGTSDEMSLLKVKCIYRDPMTKEMVVLKEAGEVKIFRPQVTSGQEAIVSIEVDRQRIRLSAAQAISEARVLAECGNLTEAASLLERCRRVLSGTVSAKAGDQLYVALREELREMQERMVSRQVYETSGRAYVLSGLSSHSWQRATARGDLSGSNTRVLQTYQTPSMVDMVNLSQTMIFGSPNPNGNSNQMQQRKLRQAHSFPARPRPR